MIQDHMYDLLCRRIIRELGHEEFVRIERLIANGGSNTVGQMFQIMLSEYPKNEFLQACADKIDVKALFAFEQKKRG